uniref:Secreted protein n=1 Tax=Anguilla anguilla TaxID=7936 RepID=A0A0E9VUS0_ANGAN
MHTFLFLFHFRFLYTAQRLVCTDIFYFSNGTASCQRIRVVSSIKTEHYPGV